MAQPGRAKCQERQAISPGQRTLRTGLSSLEIRESFFLPPMEPIGKARIIRPGRDLSIVTNSAMVHEALAVAQQFSANGIEIEVVDLRSIKPLDTDTVLASVARTGRLLCVGESFPWGGATAEVIARVTSQGFHLLDAAPQRLNAKDTPIPYHPDLWSTHRPNAKNVAAKARALLRE